MVPGSSGGVMHKKLGPVPMPVVIVGGVAIAYYAYSRWKAKGSAATSATTTPAGTAGAAGVDPSTAAGLDQLAQQQAQSNQELAQTINANEQANNTSLIAQILSMFPTGSTGTSSTGTDQGTGTGTSTNTQTSTAVPVPAPPSPLPGTGAGVAQLLAANPSLSTPGAVTPGITGYTVTYNGIPIPTAA